MKAKMPFQFLSRKPYAWAWQFAFLLLCLLFATVLFSLSHPVSCDECPLPNDTLRFVSLIFALISLLPGLALLIQLVDNVRNIFILKPKVNKRKIFITIFLAMGIPVGMIILYILLNILLVFWPIDRAVSGTIHLPTL